LQSVPDEPADVELVVQDPGAAQGVTPDRGVAPESTAGPRDLVGVEAMGNCPRRLAGYELPEYPADDPGLDLIDPPAPMDGPAAEVLLPDNIVPVREPPA